MWTKATSVLYEGVYANEISILSQKVLNLVEKINK